MTFPLNRVTRDFKSFRESTKEVDQTVRAVIIENETNDPVPVVINPITTTKITNLDLPVINTEVSHAFVNGLKQVIIRNRNNFSLKFSMVLNESGTNFFTLKAGAIITLDGLLFTGQTIYMQSQGISMIEILELS